MTIKEKRKNSLLPNGIPRYVRCYDNGGESADRYTVVFTGNYVGREGCDYVGMSEYPFHPQGVSMHSWSEKIIPAIGKKNHLGTRICFEELPDDCQKLVLRDYKETWSLQ